MTGGWGERLLLSDDERIEKRGPASGLEMLEEALEAPGSWEFNSRLSCKAAENVPLRLKPALILQAIRWG
jgi:hypothetical protein